MSHLRHSFSTYDQVLSVAGADDILRDTLRRRIKNRAYETYRWLRSQPDPRIAQPAEKQQEKVYKLFNELSRSLSDLYSDRSQLTLALRELRHKRTAAGVHWREYVAELETELAVVNKEIARLETYTKPIVFDGEQGRLICARLREPGYSFAGRDLPESYTKSAGFRCPACQRLVMRSKAPIDCGAGIRLTAFSCLCRALVIEGKYALGVKLKIWQMGLSDPANPADCGTG